MAAKIDWHETKLRHSLTHRVHSTNASDEQLARYWPRKRRSAMYDVSVEIKEL